MHNLIRILFLVLLLIPFSYSWSAVERHALVIGNAHYDNQPVLRNTLNDARDIAAKLKKQGFSVTKVEDTKRRDLGHAVNNFLRKVQGSSGIVLIYYSGHGIQLNGDNYLLPVDAVIEDSLDVPNEALAMDHLMMGLNNRGDSAINLMIFDACRNNPFKTNNQRAIGDKGLARVSAPNGSLVLYATKPGDTASDNPEGRNGLFTKHLLKVMDQPGLQVEEVFKKVAHDVWIESGRKQLPWQEGVIFGRVSFVPETVPAQPLKPEIVVSSQPVSSQSQEVIFWQSVLTNPTASGYQAYIDAYPNGSFSSLARVRLSEFEEKILSTKHALTVITTPSDTKIRILNISPTYQSGMMLNPGAYHVEVSRANYQLHTEWINLKDRDLTYHIKLEKIKKPKPPKASVHVLLGKWSLNWKGAKNNYTGYLNITDQRSSDVFRGKLHLEFGDNEWVDQDATITVNNKNITVSGSNPSRSSWNPDNFYLTLEGSRMKGHSVDSAGNRGKSITLWK